MWIKKGNSWTWKETAEHFPKMNVMWLNIIQFECFLEKVKVKVKSRPTLCSPMDCSLSGFSVHGIFQARVLEWIAVSFSRGSSWPRNRTRVSCIAGRRFTVWATREAYQGYMSLIFQTSFILTTNQAICHFPWDCLHILTSGPFPFRTKWMIRCAAQSFAPWEAFCLALSFRAIPCWV